MSGVLVQAPHVHRRCRPLTLPGAWAFTQQKSSERTTNKDPVSYPVKVRGTEGCGGAQAQRWRSGGHGSHRLVFDPRAPADSTLPSRCTLHWHNRATHHEDRGQLREPGRAGGIQRVSGHQPRCAPRRPPHRLSRVCRACRLYCLLLPAACLSCAALSAQSLAVCLNERCVHRP